MIGKKILISFLFLISFNHYAQTLNVIMGGFNSCGFEPVKNDKDEVIGSKVTPILSDMHSKLFEQQAEGQISIAQNPYIVSCHDMSGNIYYVSSTEPNKVIELKKPETEDREKVFKEAIEKDFNASAELGVRQVNLVGHSHGGWLAMTMAESLDKDIPINNLYTIDPISKVHCGISDYGVFGGSSPDCLRYPRDFTKKRIKAIKKKVKVWKNYWQDEDEKLHSSAIPGVENIKMKLSHTGVDNSDYVWNGINQDITDQHNRGIDCFRGVLGQFYKGVSELMLPGVSMLMIHSEKGLTVDDEINPHTLERLNNHLARGEFDKVENFIRKYPEILEYELFDPFSMLQLAKFIEEGHHNINHSPEVKKAISLYAKVLKSDPSKLDLDARLIDYQARNIAIERVLGIYQAASSEQENKNRDLRASVEYWQGKLEENTEQLEKTEKDIADREYEKEHGKKPKKGGFFKLFGK